MANISSFTSTVKVFLNLFVLLEQQDAKHHVLNELDVPHLLI